MEPGGPAAKRIDVLARRTGVDASRAAKKILEVVRKGKIHVRIGRDSFILDGLKRIAPVGIHRRMTRVAKTRRPKVQATTTVG